MSNGESEIPDGSGTGVNTPEDLLSELDASGIVYCHWKSNSHLDAALAGVTDLDLLFDDRQINAVHARLVEGGYKRFVTHPSRSYPGVEDFLHVHPNTGSLVHLHVQYRLLTGQRHMKNYRLPWEDRVLATRARDSASGVFIADPAHELFLLVVRAAMKIRWRDRLRASIRSEPVAAEIQEEFGWLAARADQDFVPKIAEDLLGGPCADLVANCLDSELGFGDLLRLRRRLKDVLRNQRAYGTLVAALLRGQREFRWALGSVNRKTLRGPFPYARTPASGGLIIAVIGGDGSGKSTVTRELYRWLEGKVDVMPVYFGSGKGRGTLLRLPLKVARRLRRSGRSAKHADSPRAGDKKPGFNRAVWGLVLAREKQLKIRRALRARARGFIVVCDRYPQTQTPGLIDGPLLTPWLQSDSRIRRRLARWETAPYVLAQEVGPDIVFRLDVSGPTAASRRPEVAPLELDGRRGVVEGLTFDQARHGVHSIDAERDLNSVLLDVKQQLWRVL